MGQRASSTTGVTFDDVRVPKKVSYCFTSEFSYLLYDLINYIYNKGLLKSRFVSQNVYIFMDSIGYYCT